MSTLTSCWLVWWPVFNKVLKTFILSFWDNCINTACFKTDLVGLVLKYHNPLPDGQFLAPGGL